eukprot:g9037.t1
MTEPRVIGEPGEIELGSTSIGNAGGGRPPAPTTTLDEDRDRVDFERAAASWRSSPRGQLPREDTEDLDEDFVPASSGRSTPFKYNSITVVLSAVASGAVFLLVALVWYPRFDMHSRRPIKAANDARLAFPWQADTVPMPALFGAALLVSTLLLHGHKSRSAVLCPTLPRLILCAYFWCVILIAKTLHFVLKVYVGRARPCFYELCDFDFATRSCRAPEMKRVRSAYTSFPSGHATSVAATFGFLVLDSDCAVTAGLSFVAALLVGLSRITDNRHEPADVLAGWMLGAACAYVGYAHLLRMYGQEDYQLHQGSRVRLRYELQ